MVTPVSDDTGEIDETALRAYAAFLVEEGAHGLFPCGSTGEFPSLSRRQRRSVVETVADVAGDVPVLAGCGDTSLEAVCGLVDDAAAAGADAAVVVTPYYLEASQESLRTFYGLVADRSPLPVVLYEIPALTGHRLATDTVASLAGHENVVGLKTSAGDPLQFFELVQRTPPTFALLTGTPELTTFALDVGGSGVVAGPANVFPSVVSRVFEHRTRGEYDRAVRLMNDVVLPVLRVVRSMPTIPALKHLVGLRGFDVGPALPPVPDLTGVQRQSLERCYDEVRAADSREDGR